MSVSYKFWDSNTLNTNFRHTVKNHYSFNFMSRLWWRSLDYLNKYLNKFLNIQFKVFQVTNCKLLLSVFLGVECQPDEEHCKDTKRVRKREGELAFPENMFCFHMTIGNIRWNNVYHTNKHRKQFTCFSYCPVTVLFVKIRSIIQLFDKCIFSRCFVCTSWI